MFSSCISAILEESLKATTIDKEDSGKLSRNLNFSTQNYSAGLVLYLGQREAFESITSKIYLNAKDFQNWNCHLSQMHSQRARQVLEESYIDCTRSAIAVASPIQPVKIRMDPLFGGLFMLSFRLLKLNIFWIWSWG